MSTKEIYTDNFAKALLRASLLLGSLHRTCPIRRISILAFSHDDRPETRSTQCIITMAPGSAFNPPQRMDADSCMDYDILFPAYSPHFS